MKSRLKKVIVFTFVLTLFPNLEIRSYETLFPEPELSCPYHSCGVGPGSVYEWYEDIYETDENLVDENVGFKSFLVGEWVHKKYWDGHWECVPYNKSLYVFPDFVAPFVELPGDALKSQYSPPDFVDLSGDALKNSYPPSPFYQTSVFPPLDFYLPEATASPIIQPIDQNFEDPFKICFKRLYINANLEILGARTTEKENYTIEDYTLILKYLLNVASRDIMKLIQPFYAHDIMLQFIENLKLKTSISLTSTYALLSYSKLKSLLKEKETCLKSIEEFCKGNIYAEDLYKIAIEICSLRRSGKLNTAQFNEVRRVFNELMRYIPEGSWKTEVIQ